MRIKNIISGMLAAMMVFAGTGVFARVVPSVYYDYDGNKHETGVSVFINGAALDTSGVHSAEIINDFTMVPMRVLFEKLGAGVEWSEAEQSVYAQRGGRALKLSIGSLNMTLYEEAENGGIIVADAALEVPPMLMPYDNYAETTMVPLRAVSEFFGCDVIWREDEFVVYITDDYVKPEIILPEIVDIHISEKIQPASRVDIDGKSVVFIKDNGTVWQGDIEKGDYTKVKGLSNIIAVSNARNAFYALNTSGEVYSWGTSNTFGQLGRDGEEAPAKIEGLKNIVKIDAGISFGAALDVSGRLYTWGRNDHGQLGLGTTYDALLPVQVEIGAVKDFAAGTGHMTAVSSKSRVYTWGENGEGQLGRGAESTSYKSSPAVIKSLYNIESVYAGMTSSAAIRKDKSIYFWGTTYLGEPADGYGPLIMTEDITAEIDDNGNMKYPKPLRICNYVYDPIYKEETTDILLGAQSVSCGEYQAAAIADGKLYLWGDSPAMRHSTRSQLLRYCAQEYTGLSDVKAVYSGLSGTVYALYGDGAVWKIVHNSKQKLFDVK